MRNEPEDLEGFAARYIKGVGAAAVVLLAILVLCMAVSCSPKIVERVHTEYVTQTVHHRDTVSTKDSVYIREWLKGDTVYVEKFRDRYFYRDRWRDSILVQRDTTVLNRTREVRVEKPLNGWQMFRIGAFWWLLALAAVGWRKELLWLIRKAASLFG